MDDATTVVSAQIPTQKREEWSNYVDNTPHVNSMSHLLRMAVQKEIHGQQSEGGGVSEEVEQRLSEVVSGMQEMESAVHELNSRLDAVERQLNQDSPEVEELANRVFRILPTEGKLLADTHQPVVEAESDESGQVVESGRVDHIATYLGENEVRVGEALQKLQDDTTLVQTKTISGTTRYYKEE